MLPNTGAICSGVQQAAVILGLVIGLSNLAVWVHGAVPDFLLHSGMMVMRLNTALAICGAALSLACWRGEPGALRKALARSFAVVPLLIGALTSVQDLAGVGLGIDEFFGPGVLSGDLASNFVVHTGRMSLNAALGLFSLGLALVAIDFSLSLGRWRFNLSPAFALIATLPITLGLVGHLLGIDRFTGLLRSTNILIHTAIAILGLAGGVLAARPQLPPVRRIFSTGADGILLRWTLPGSAGLLLGLGWLIGRGRAAQQIASGEGAAIMLYGGLVLLFWLLIFASGAVARQEARVREASEKLRQAKEAAEAASRAKDNFVAALSHELRTPLAPVLLSAAALRDDDRLPADVREQMAMMERNIALEARLIDDLLDLTRISRGKLPLRAEALEIHSLISHAVDIVREDARARSIEVVVEFRAGRSGLTGDAARLQQVFWNLLKNAVKFTPAGGRITIVTRNTAEGDRLVVEVRDTGAGFFPKAAERIFQPFEQAGREGDHRLGGLGLGLAIARAIVDLHGGRIHAQSPGPGLGATFTVEMPGASAPPSGVSPVESLEKPEAPLPAQRILLVEDHEPTLSVLTRLLRRTGHDVTPAATVSAALAAAEGADFDLIISDLGLPDGTGVELLAGLRARELGCRAIALSGYGMEEDLQRTREAGFDDHLVKPVDFDQLRRAIRKLTL